MLVPGDDKVWIVWSEKNGNKAEAEKFLTEIMESIEDSIEPSNRLVKTLLSEKEEDVKEKKSKKGGDENEDKG